MIYRTEVSSLPEGFLDNLRDWEDMDLWRQLNANIFRMSRLMFVGWEDEKPLVAVGAVQMNLLSTEAEVWFLATKALNFSHLPSLRALFREWLGEYRGLPLVARAKSEIARDTKFIRWFGGQLISADSTEQLYKVTP